MWVSVSAQAQDTIGTLHGYSFLRRQEDYWKEEKGSTSAGLTGTWMYAEVVMGCGVWGLQSQECGVVRLAFSAGSRIRTPGHNWSLAFCKRQSGSLKEETSARLSSFVPGLGISAHTLKWEQ